jgi:PEGA domain
MTSGLKKRGRMRFRFLLSMAVAVAGIALFGAQAVAFFPPPLTRAAPAGPVMPAGPTAPAGSVVPTAPTVATPALPAATVPMPAPSPTSSPKAPPQPNKLGEARLHFQQGVALYQDQNYDAALAEFEGAYSVSGEPIVLYNMGLTYKALFRYGEAIDRLEKYLGESGGRGQAVSKDRRAEVERFIAEMKSLLADVTIVVKPAVAAVRVDGHPIALGIEGIVKLSAGTHTVEASANDFTAGKRDVTVVAGTPQTVSMVLVAIPRTGHVRIAATQIGARVGIDGHDMGSAPAEVDVLAGGHQIDVTAPGFAPYRSELVVAAGQSRDVTIALELQQVRSDTLPFYHRWWFWAGVGVAAAAVTTIAVLPKPTQSPLDGSLGTTNTNIGN